MPFRIWVRRKNGFSQSHASCMSLRKGLGWSKRDHIAAPYWDLSFPAILKQYLEHVCVVGLTFCYENDLPKGLCRAKKLYYVTTAGGRIVSEEYGFGYVKALANNFFGIHDCRLIKAENLDMFDSDADLIMKKACLNIPKL